MTTLRDLSRELGLSVTQVSRALNGHSDVNAETRARVTETAQRLGYRPNLSARRLVTGRSGSVGLVLPSLDRARADPLFVESIGGLSAAFSRRDIRFLLHVADGEEKVEAAYRSLYRSGALDGFVLQDPARDDPRVALLRGLGAPFVIHGRSLARRDYPFYDIDNFAVGRLLAEQLLAAGHHRLAVLNGAAEASFAAARDAGIAAALAQAEAPPATTLHGPMTRERGLVETVALLRETGPGARITGLIASNAALAEGALQAAAALGLAVPRDLSVVAHDDLLPGYDTAGQRPALTVTESPLADAWEPLADLLTLALAGAPLEKTQRIGALRVVARASVAPPRQRS